MLDAIAWFLTEDVHPLQFFFIWLIVSSIVGYRIGTCKQAYE